MSCAKYFYRGISLYEYCKENGLSYYKILKRIELKGMSVTDAVEAPGHLRTRYICKNGIPLIKKCTHNEYSKALYRINYGKKSVDVDTALDEYPRHRSCTLFYNGKSFKEICCDDKKRYARACWRFRKGYSKWVSLFGDKWDLIYG